MSVDYFDRLEAELRAAVPRVAGHSEPGSDAVAGHSEPGRDAVAGSVLRPRRPFPRVPLAPLGLAAAIAVAVAVVVGGIALLGHGRPAASVPTQSGPAPAATAGAYPTLDQLLAHFAVLRRPQNGADRSWQPNYGDNPPQAVPMLARLARRLPGGDRVFLTVQHRPPAVGYELFAWTVSRDGDVNGSGFGPPSYTMSPNPTRGPSAGDTRWTSIVPDAVNQVIWTFGCPHPTGSCSRLVRSVIPAGNIATAAIPGTSSCGDGTCREAIAATWYATDGGIVAHWSRSEHRRLAAPPFVATNPTAPLLGPIARILRGDGVAGIRFGAARRTVLRALTAMLGPPAHAAATPGACTADHVLTWAGPRAMRALSVYVRHGRFVGYEYGDSAKPRPSAALLATTRGLTPGDTVARARQIYGSAFRLSFAQGGSFSVRTASGRLIGYLTVVARGGNIRSGRNPIGTIDAGDVGCPAMTP